MPKKTIKFLSLFLPIVIFTLNAGQFLSYAAEDDEVDRTTQREDARQEQKEERLNRIDTASELIKLLKERAMLKIKKKKKELLLKTTNSLSVLYGFETNVTNASDTKGDFYHEEDYYFDWKPTFNKNFSADVGYWAINQRYSEQTDLSSLDHAVNTKFIYYPFKNRKLKLEPGFEYEWLWYPLSKESGYDNFKYFLGFKQYVGKKWNYGGKYQHENKIYDDKKARDAAKNYLELNREDNRHTIELYTTRYMGKYSVKLKGKVYKNTSNDHYKEYYDYSSYKGYFTLAGSFLKDDKLYLSFTPSFEWKQYKERTAVETIRADDVYNYSLSAYYTWFKPFTLTYKFTYKKVATNYSPGRYKNITNVIGLTTDF